MHVCCTGTSRHLQNILTKHVLPHKLISAFGTLYEHFCEDFDKIKIMHIFKIYRQLSAVNLHEIYY